MTFVRNLLVLAAFSAASSAFAADAAGAYALIGGGTSKINGDCVGTTSCDTTGNSFKIVGGYRLGNGVAIEGVALDFGKAKVVGPFGGSTVAGELKSSGFGAGVAFYGDFGPNWTGTFRIGGISMKGKTSVSGTGFSGSESKTSTQAYFGFGLAYRFTDTVYAEFGADASRAKFSSDDEFTVRAFTLGVGVRF